jgi:hypothetical protein
MRKRPIDRACVVIPLADRDSIFGLRMVAWLGVIPRYDADRRTFPFGLLACNQATRVRKRRVIARAGGVEYVDTYFLSVFGL